jgi:hypothetical protein
LVITSKKRKVKRQTERNSPKKPNEGTPDWKNALGKKHEHYWDVIIFCRDLSPDKS